MSGRFIGSSFVSIISEFSHMFGQALAQWRAFSLAVARSSRLHSFIGENIRLLYDIMKYTDINDIPGSLLLIDFEKAFDSISHEFIMQVLDFFFFFWGGASIKSWVKLIYEDAFSCVLVNGHLTNRYKIERGCRQGDPLSPYIFLLCAEILSILIRKNSNINGLTVGNDQHKIIQYADDTVITLDGSKEDLQETLTIFNKFAMGSGLPISKQKNKSYMDR